MTESKVLTRIFSFGRVVLDPWSQLICVSLMCITGEPQRALGSQCTSALDISGGASNAQFTSKENLHLMSMHAPAVAFFQPLAVPYLQCGVWKPSLFSSLFYRCIGGGAIAVSQTDPVAQSGVMSIHVRSKLGQGKFRSYLLPPGAVGGLYGSGCFHFSSSCFVSSMRACITRISS